tara:strand:+ start:7649 stop:7771 length:123 start_codon:yes stop_codon:yes gene_type:complete
MLAKHAFCQLNYTPLSKRKNIEIKLSEEMGFEPMVHFIAR